MTGTDIREQSPYPLSGRLVPALAVMLLSLFNPGSRASAATPGIAQDPTQESIALEHFRKGLKIMDRVPVGSRDPVAFEQALMEFSKSYQAMPTPGALFNVGVMQSKLGRDAKACRTFDRYLGTYPQDRADRRRDAKAELRKLGFGRMRLSIEPPDAIVEFRDSRATPSSSGEVACVVAGSHTLKVSRAGYGTETRSVTVHANEELRLRVELRRDRTAMRITGYSASAIGVVGLGLALGFNIHKNNELEKRDGACPGAPGLPCESEGDRQAFLSHQQNAKRSQAVALSSAVVGGLLLSAGIPLVIIAGRASRSSPEAVRIEPGISRKGAHVSARITW